MLVHGCFQWIGLHRVKSAGQSRPLRLEVFAPGAEGWVLGFGFKVRRYHLCFPLVLRSAFPVELLVNQSGVRFYTVAEH